MRHYEVAAKRTYESFLSLEANRQKTDALKQVQSAQSKKQCATFFSYRYITLLKEYDQ